MKIDRLYQSDELREKGIVLAEDPHRLFQDTDGKFGPAGEEEWMAIIRDPGGNMVGFASRKKIGA